MLPAPPVGLNIFGDRRLPELLMGEVEPECERWRLLLVRPVMPDMISVTLDKSTAHIVKISVLKNEIRLCIQYSHLSENSSRPGRMGLLSAASSQCT